MAVQADLVAYLKELQTHRSFQSLSVEDKVMFAELVQAAETDTLKAFIDRVTFLEIIHLLDRMSYADAIKFSGYLAENLGYHHHTDTVQNEIINRRDINKRDRDEDEHEDFHSMINGMSVRYYGRLPSQEKQIWNNLVQAAQHNRMTQYITDHGYGQIFGVLEHLDYLDAQTFMNFLEMQLQTEASAAGPAKRQSGGSSWWQGWSGSHYHDTLTKFRPDYYNKLSPEEKATWDGLTNAAKTDTVTLYIQQVGYGPIFGLLEHLDSDHGNDFMDSLEYQLEKEAGNINPTN